MKLIHVVPSLEERHGGPSRSVPALCAALARAGHEVSLFTTGPAGVPVPPEKRLRIDFFPRDWPERLCPSRALRAALRDRPADIVHHHALWLRTLHYARQAASPLVISPRGMMSPWAVRHHAWRKKFAATCVHPGAFASARGWHATSPEEADDIRAQGFSQPVCVAPNGIEPPSPEGVAESLAHWRAACPESSHRPIALFYSRLHRKKRVLDLVDLWLAQSPPDWLLLLAGIPEDYRPEDIERHATRRGGGGRVRAFDSLGRPPPYAIASLFLLPSHNENFGLVVAEAMARGLPALVTDTTPWREITRRDLGWCVPWAEYGEALRAATTESTLSRQARGERARDWILSEFSWDKSAERLAGFYRELLDDRNSRSPRSHAS